MQRARPTSRLAIASALLASTIVACAGGGNDAGPGPSVTNTGRLLGVFGTHGRASVIQTTGRVLGFREMRITGGFFLAATSRSPDGKSHRLQVDGGTATLRGDDIGLLARVVTIAPGSIDASADRIPAKARRPAADRATLAPRVIFSTDIEVDGTRVTLDGKAVRGPHTFHVPDGRATLYGSATISPLPSRFRIEEDDTGRSPRAGFATPTFFSWKGSGTTALGAKRFSPPLTVLVRVLKVSVQRSPGALDMDGGGVATQIAIDGKPQFRTTLEAKVTTPDRALYPGISEQLTWVMETSGPWEAIITAVRAVNAAAKWTRLHVDDPPPLELVSGESFARAPLRCVAGTAAFAEFYLCAQIAPEKGAEAPVVFHVPFFQRVGRYDAVFEIAGNFPTVRVRVPMDVQTR